MRRSSALGIISDLIRVGIGVRRAGSGGANPILVRFVANITGTNLNWANGSAAPNLYDGIIADNTTFYQQTAGAGQTAHVIGMYDLGTPTVVTRCRYRYGTANGNNRVNSTELIEASNDGSTWVTAWTGGDPFSEIGAGIFQWNAERDFSTITTTPYRYWRVGVRDVFTDGNPDARLSDFRLYTAGGIVVP